ncbi:MAG: rhodanese-like domain-containing protein [Bacteroidetes bacterium]|nr:rhodanese-like domain-containing protein [Bacteroidota bacterium]
MQEITVEAFKKRLDSGEQIHLLDVREPDEFADYNLGGKLLPLGNIMAMQVDEIEDWKDDEIVVHCRSGKRSLQACLMLETLGYKNLKNLTGGALAWQELMK